MNQCFQQYGMEPDVFLVYITHDDSVTSWITRNRPNPSAYAVFRCMRNALKACPAAKKVLAFWGHQQASLDNAVNLICRDLPLYSKGVQCFANGNSQVQQCISNTESKMMNIADKQVTKNLSPDSYFRDFCSIRVEHLRCDLNGWSQTCDADVVGLKTEFECKLIQEHCKNLQVGNFKTICNDNTYKTNTRGSGGSSGNGGGSGGSTGLQSGDNGSSMTSGSLFALLGSVVATLFFIVL